MLQRKNAFSKFTDMTNIIKIVIGALRIVEQFGAKLITPQNETATHRKLQATSFPTMKLQIVLSLNGMSGLHVVRNVDLARSFVTEPS